MGELNRFDETDRPSSSIIDDCVHCGFCLSACPTYVETGNELDSPRGRIYLVKSVLEENIPLGNSVVDHLDKCLGCLACETACPSGVKYRFLIENSRAQIERNHQRGLREKLLRGFIFSLFPYEKKLSRFLPLLYLYEKSGLRRLINSTGLLKRLSKTLYKMERMVPGDITMGTIKFPEVNPPRGKATRRVALLTGCIQNVFFSKTNAATLNVLTKTGCEVIVPPGQSCCGALSVHSGRLEEGREFARKTIDMFSSLDVDYFIINSAGCGSAIKEYGELLKDDHVYAKKAVNLSTKTRDIMEFLDEVGLDVEFKKLNLKITYQDACHVSHGQGINAAPRNLLSKIPGLELIEMRGSDTCCGSAGIYNILQSDMADRILGRKISNIRQTGSQMVLAGNPGCLMQIRKGLSDSKLKMGIAHPIEIIDRAIS